MWGERQSKKQLRALRRTFFDLNAHQTNRFWSVCHTWRWAHHQKIYPTRQLPQRQNGNERKIETSNGARAAIRSSGHWGWFQELRKMMNGKRNNNNLPILLWKSLDQHGCTTIRHLEIKWPKQGLYRICIVQKTTDKPFSDSTLATLHRWASASRFSCSTEGCARIKYAAFIIDC